MTIKFNGLPLFNIYHNRVWDLWTEIVNKQWDVHVVCWYTYNNQPTNNKKSIPMIEWNYVDFSPTLSLFRNNKATKRQNDDKKKIWKKNLYYKWHSFKISNYDGCSSTFLKNGWRQKISCHFRRSEQKKKKERKK